MKHIKKAISFSLSIVLIFSIAYFIFEPAVSKAVADSADVTQSVTEEITVSAPSNTALAPSIPGMTGNPGSPSTASLTWTVKTVNATGFAMTIQASQVNALFNDGTYFFSDYTAVGDPVPDYTWTSPSASAAEFGFTIEPATAADTVANFLDNGTTTCNTGATQTADKCWLGLTGATPISMINRSTNTDSSGEAEVVNFKAESNAKFLKEGTYTATITVTATMN